MRSQGMLKVVRLQRQHAPAFQKGPCQQSCKFKLRAFAGLGESCLMPAANTYYILPFGPGTSKFSESFCYFYPLSGTAQNVLIWPTGRLPYHTAPKELQSSAVSDHPPSFGANMNLVGTKCGDGGYRLPYNTSLYLSDHAIEDGRQLGPS
jgi:hypothetical protein